MTLNEKESGSRVRRGKGMTLKKVTDNYDGQEPLIREGQGDVEEVTA